MEKRAIKNILVFINSLEKGGAELQAVELANALKDAYNVYLAVFYGSNLHPELIQKLDKEKVKLLCFSGKKWKVVFELRKTLKKYKIDCIYSFLATTNVYTGIIGKACNIPYLIGGIRNSHYSGLKYHIQKYLHNHIFTLSVSNNYYGATVLINKGFKKEKFKVIHNAFVPKVTGLSKTYNTIPIIISVARFVIQKDYFTALKAIHNIRINNPALTFRYRIIGYGPLENEIRQQIKTMQLEDITEVLINPLNIDQYLFSSDIFLQTSLFEGTSNAILEAMYAKLPIVATKVGDNEYMVSPENGFLSEVKQSKQLAEKMGILLKDKNLRQGMGEKSREIVCGRFTVETFKQKHLQLLNELQQQYV